MAGTILKTIAALAAVCMPVFSENLVLLNDAFPYRVVSSPGWVESLKNDSVLILDYNVSGKRNQFRLERHKIDTTSNLQNREWSRLQYTVNKEFAAEVGRQVYADSGQEIKFGGCQAYEMFAYYSRSEGGGVVWWADYARWTEKDGYGFLASIIGDTLEMKRNLETHRAFLDSISLTRLSTAALPRPHDGTVTRTAGTAPSVNSGAFDLLGRMLPVYVRHNGIVLAPKQARRCPVDDPSRP